MDQVRGRTPRAGHDNIHTVQISRTKQLDLGALDGYIDTNRYHDTDVIEAISFLNHLIRFTPSANLISLGRSFFSPTLSNYRDLEPGLMACRGIFQSLRAAEVCCRIYTSSNC